MHQANIGETPIIQAELLTLAGSTSPFTSFNAWHTAILQLSEGDTPNTQTTYSLTNTYSLQCLPNCFPWTLITTKPLILHQATYFPFSNIGCGLNYHQYPLLPSFVTVCCQDCALSKWLLVLAFGAGTACNTSLEVFFQRHQQLPVTYVAQAGR